jgi:uncharacterized iron-regulated protein
MRDLLIDPGRRARVRGRPSPGRRSAVIALACAAIVSLAGCAGPGPSPDAPRGVGAPLPAEAGALADAIRGVPVVLLGELHDNPEHHALRAAALARLVSDGARPALAFEQFDRERQPDIDRSRRERPRDADALIAGAGGRGWDWPQYRPFVQLALDHDLPIVAANLSRTDAGRVMREGFGAVFDAQTRAALGLDALPAALLASHERAVIDGHCGLLPAAMAGPMARAQVARDVALATAIAPHAARGVVLLTGNAHARRDVGVPRWLPEALRGDALLAVGLLEKRADGTTSGATPTRAFDRIVTTGAPAREDPCTALRARMPAAPAGAHERAPPARPSQDR